MYKFPSVETIEEEIDDQIVEQLNTITEIINDVEANDFIGRYKYNKELKAELEKRAKEVIENYKYKVNLWLQRQNEIIDNENERILNMISQYYSSNESIMSGKKDKIKFVNGTVGMYTTKREGYDWDDETALLSFIKEQKNTNPLLFNGIIKLDPSLDKKAIKDRAITDEEGKVFVDGIELPYVSHHEKTTGIAIK